MAPALARQWDEKHCPPFPKETWGQNPCPAEQPLHGMLQEELVLSLPSKPSFGFQLCSARAH